jgi:tetratricopeptide (TPR) repeat protein
MATKAKSAPAPAPKSAPVAQAYPLAAAFAKAIALVDAGKHAEALKALDALMLDAQAAGDWAMKRRAQVYHTLCASKVAPAKAVVPDYQSEIQACLNRNETAEALKLIDKAVKSHAGQGSLHYLRAVAFAQQGNTEASADSLRKALELEHDLVFQWHMEPDFNPIRKSPLFAFTEGR